MSELRNALIGLLGGPLLLLLLGASTALSQEAEETDAVAPTVSNADEPAAVADDAEAFSRELIDQLVAAHSSYVESGDAQKALQSAALLREIYEERYGADSFEALPYIRLHAHSYRRLGDHNNARRLFERVIALTERYDGLYSFSLVDMLGNLSQQLVELGEVEAAESALLRAKFITHRRLGITNLDQVEVLRALSDFYLDSSQIERAQREQDFMLRIHERKYGEGSPDLIPALFEYADFYVVGLQDFQRALPVYRRALEILEEAYGEDDLRLVEPLKGIALTYSKRSYFRGEGKRALDRAVSLYENDEYADVDDYVEALLIRGDWYLQSNNPGEAVVNYQRVWQLLAETDSSGGRAQAQFSQPYQVEYIYPQYVYPSLRSRPGLSPENYLELTFTVSPEGRVTKARVSDSTATRRMENESLSAIRAAHFRPALVDGEPVAADVTMRQFFRARPSRKK
ncbi:MAG: TonB family protein [Pseudomonadota bacterium]